MPEEVETQQLTDFITEVRRAWKMHSRAGRAELERRVSRVIDEMIPRTQWFTEASNKFRERITTPKRRELFDAMLAKLGHGWTFVPTNGYFTIRYDRELPFPEYMDRGAYKNWGPTYDQHVFVTLVTPDSSPLVRVLRASWVSGRDCDVTLKRALEILDNPTSLLD